MSVMGNSTEDKYLIKSLRENNKYYGEKRLLKLFPSKNCKFWWTESADQKLDNTLTVHTVRGQPLPICRTTVLVLHISYFLVKI